MEFCQLGDLATFVKKRDKLAVHPVTADMLRSYPNPSGAGFNEVIVRHFAKQLGSALEFLRAKNLVHRDLKPQNLLLNPPPAWIAKEKPENRPFAKSRDSLKPVAGLESLPFLKIADFGFARHLPTTTMAETLCGSPLYMAPEILRYEKYDAKADLWSVGTVLYELMVGKPPFRAANHVDLLRKIEKTMDKIKFQDDLAISNAMETVIRGLLKRMPTERMSWDDFFKSAIITTEIPNLVVADMPKRPGVSRTTSDKRSPQPADANLQEAGPSETKPTQQNLDKRSSFERSAANVLPQRRPSAGAVVQQRPGLPSHVTEPVVQGVRNDRITPPTLGERRSSHHPSATNTPAPRSMPEREKPSQKTQDNLAREVRERAAQDVALEKDYVMVEKRAVEVNAFADELAASPQIYPGNRDGPASQPGNLVRRATTQGSPGSATGAQPTQQGRNMQVALRPDATSHQRRPSYERRYGSHRGSATSALAAALNMVNFRLYGTPLAPMFGKTSPPSQGYAPYPTFPATPGMPLLINDSPKPAKMDEDHRVLSTMEESATRSDVVYGFAEVKYKQLIPIAPSNDHGLGIRRPGAAGTTGDEADDDGDLTFDAILAISDEALVLYIKALAILTNTINLAGSWWSHKRQGDVVGEPSSSPRSVDSGKANFAAVGGRINNVVQWARNRFNECLEKSEYVHRRLTEAQRKIAEERDKNQVTWDPNTGLGITAEKLMYDRALEMSKSAAVNELVGEDLMGCEVSYLTAVRLLEAVLEREDGDAFSPSEGNTKEQRRSGIDGDEDAEIGDEIDEGDRQTVMKRMITTDIRVILPSC